MRIYGHFMHIYGHSAATAANSNVPMTFSTTVQRGMRCLPACLLACLPVETRPSTAAAVSRTGTSYGQKENPKPRSCCMHFAVNSMPMSTSFKEEERGMLCQSACLPACMYNLDLPRQQRCLVVALGAILTLLLHALRKFSEKKAPDLG